MYYTMNCLDPEEGTLARMEYDESLDEDFMRSWMSGEVFEIQPPLPVVLTQTSGGVMPEMLQVPVPIMTQRLYNVLRDAGVANLEIFPAEIHDPRRNTIHADYVAFNVVGCIRANALVHDHDPSLHVARLEESVNVLLVHQTIKEAILNAGISTMTFYELSEIAIV